MTTRDERVQDLFFVQPNTPGDPNEDGQIRVNAAGTDLVAFIDGGVKSLTAGASSTLLGRSIFKVDGGMIYDTSGDIMIKVNQ